MPRVSPLNSQVAFRSQASGGVFNIAGVLEGFHGSCPDRVSFPVQKLTFVPPFSVFLVGGLPRGGRQSLPTVLMHSSNRLPSG